MGGTICRMGRNPDQVSRGTLWLPWFFVNKFLEALRIAEETLGRPPNVPEIFVTLRDTQGHTQNSVLECGAILFAILREDLIYIERNAYRYSLYKHEGFETYSEIFRRYWPEGYACDSMGRVVPTTARRVNFKQLRATLTSSDPALMDEHSYIWDGEFRFLDGESLEGNRIGFASIPRSGNSFLRRYCEQILGITTGSAGSIHVS